LNGKGDTYRPVSKDYAKKYDQIEWRPRVYQIIDKDHEFYGEVVQSHWKTQDGRFAVTGKRDGKPFSTFCKDEQLEKIERWKL